MEEAADLVSVFDASLDQKVSKDLVYSKVLNQLPGINRVARFFDYPLLLSGLYYHILHETKDCKFM